MLLPPKAIAAILGQVLDALKHMPETSGHSTQAAIKNWIGRIHYTTDDRDNIPAGLLRRVAGCDAVNSGYLERPDWWFPYITSHTIDRYREHYPAKGSLNTVLWDLAGSVEVQLETVKALLGRPTMQAEEAKYFLGRERRGIFVLKKADWDSTSSYLYTVLTYLRMTNASVNFAQSSWPVGYV